MFLGMQNDLIAMTAETAEELENIDYMTFTEIVETEDNYILENGVYVKQDNEYFEKKLAELKAQKNTENTAKAKEAIENGYVVFKDAEFETNAQTVGDLTATMLLMQASGMETYTWLSKDDKEVDLTIEDFGTLGGLIAQYKGDIWQNKYVGFKSAIERAETIEEVEEINIDYGNNDN